MLPTAVGIFQQLLKISCFFTLTAMRVLFNKPAIVYFAAVVHGEAVTEVAEENVIISRKLNLVAASWEC
jgi:hypothetical protein